MKEQATQRHRFPPRAIKDFPRILNYILDKMVQKGFQLYQSLMWLLV